MKVLNVTKKQQQRLKVMIKACGIKFEWWDNFAYDGLLTVTKDGIYHSIHWFELLMLHLAPKIHPEWPTVDGVCVLISWSTNKTHPIDALYERFKKDFTR